MPLIFISHALNKSTELYIINNDTVHNFSYEIFIAAMALEQSNFLVSILFWFINLCYCRRIINLLLQYKHEFPKQQIKINCFSWGN